MKNMNKETLSVINESLGRISELSDEIDTVAALNPVMAAAVVDSQKTHKRIDTQMKSNFDAMDEMIEYEDSQAFDRCGELMFEDVDQPESVDSPNIHDVLIDLYIDPESDGTVESFVDMLDDFILEQTESNEIEDYPYTIIDVAVSDVDLSDEYEEGSNSIRINLTVESAEDAPIDEFFEDIKSFINADDSEVPYKILNDIADEIESEDKTDEISSTLAESLYKISYQYKKKFNKEILSEAIDKFNKLINNRLLCEGQHNFLFNDTNLVEVEKAVQEILSKHGYLVDTEEGKNYVDAVMDLLVYSPDLQTKTPKEIATEWYYETEMNYPEDLAELPRLAESIKDKQNSVIPPVVDPSAALVNTCLMEELSSIDDLDLENNCYEFCLVAVEANGYTDHFYMSDCKGESEFEKDEDAQIFVNSTCDLDDVVKVEVTRYRVGTPTNVCTILSTDDAKLYGDELLDNYDPEVIEEYEFDVICEA